MHSAIENLAYLKDLKNNRSVAIIGSMLELGKQSKSSHLKLLEIIKNNNIDKIIAIGEEMKEKFDLLPVQKKLLFIKNINEKNINSIISKLQSEDLILVKSSNSIRTHKIIEYLKSDQHVI